MITRDSQRNRVFKQIAAQHPLWKHPFLERCRAGMLEIDDVRALATQMYRFTDSFAPMLARILSYCDDEQARVVIGHNLFEELGEGKVEETHPALFRKFSRAIGIPDEALQASPVRPETRNLVDTYMELAGRHGYLGALGAVCYGSEGIVSVLYKQIETGIRGADSTLSDDDLLFFKVHVVLDVGHAAELEEVLLARLESHEQVKQVAQALNEALDARYGFFDGIEMAAGLRKRGAA